MRKRIVSICLLFACGAFVSPQPSNEEQTGSQNGTQRESGNGASFVFAGIESALRNQSRVPPRLPAYLPGVDREHSIDAILVSATSTGYEILLAVDPSCQGGNWCLYGSVRGSVSRLKLDDNTGVPVVLRHGIRGSFFESVCHAYCSQAYVEWEENGFYYAIGIKSGNKEQLIRAVNSALR